jgi:FtsZ-binding cell division protein ZapB
VTTRRASQAADETTDDIKEWLLKTVDKLWPVAAGSISLRRSPCIREHCSACERGEKHPAYFLDGRRGGRRFSLYVPNDLVGKVEQAIENGRLLELLIMEAGERYTKALKRERQLRQEQSKKKGGRKKG